MYKSWSHGLTLLVNWKWASTSVKILMARSLSKLFCLVGLQLWLEPFGQTTFFSDLTAGWKWIQSALRELFEPPGAVIPHLPFIFHPFIVVGSDAVLYDPHPIVRVLLCVCSPADTLP